jgi:tetrahydromethanopterin S-methyltransferase subunit G
MESMRESWTDERLDDLNHKVDAGFDRVDADIRGLRVEMRTEFGALRGEMKGGFDRLDTRFERIDDRFDRINERLEAMHRLLVQSFVVLLATLIGLHFV